MNLAKYFSKFFQEKPIIPDELNEIAADPDSFEKSLITSCANLIGRYQQFKTDYAMENFGRPLSSG